jgi:hypothetical protein
MPSDARATSIAQKIRRAKWAKALFPNGFDPKKIKGSEGDGPHCAELSEFLGYYVGTPHERAVWDERYKWVAINREDMPLIEEAAAAEGITRQEYIAREALKELRFFVRSQGIPLPPPPPTEAAAPADRQTKPKRSTEQGEGRAKLVAALTAHHKYAAGGCLNAEPIGNNKIARLAGVSESTASAFFNEQFGGHAKYRAICADATRLAASLKLLNGEYTPYELFGSKPPGEAVNEE